MKYQNIAIRVMVIIATMFYAATVEAAENYTKYVDPFIGTDAHGHTYPGATAPFGMVQLSPDTRLDGWDGCSGYHYSDSVIYGFSHTHLNGTGCIDYGDILFMPFCGETELEPGKYASRFSHSNETAEPGFYSVKLDKHGILAELSATPRCGVHRYSFPNTGNNKILLDLVHRDVVLKCGFKRVSDLIYTGYRFSRAWADSQMVFFAVKFRQTPQNVEIIHDSLYSKFSDPDKNIKVVFDFSGSEQVEFVVGLSAVSEENALKNLESEVGDMSFTAIRSQANIIWNKELAKIEINDHNIENKTKFYTALYHCMIQPNLYSDVNGDYRGTDKQIHNADFDYYTVFSLWDTYRAYHPLMTIIDQKRTSDWIKTFGRQYSEGGLLPVWELAANETFCMIGYHSIPVIADAVMKGIGGFDKNEIYRAMKATAMRDERGLKEYREYGFIPSELEHESVSKTLEYAYDDYCIAQVATKLGRFEDARTFSARAQYWKNMLDPTMKFMRPRYNGGWLCKFDPTEVNNNYTEGNSWQYSFYVPHDVNTMITKYGGKKLFYKKLSEMFETQALLSGRDQADLTGLIGQYAHGNEPSHHVAYLFNYVNNAGKTQKIVRNIMDSLYSTRPDGLCGNEDCGQMSAWFVMSAMGFYPLCPGSNQYLIGSPLFEEAGIHLESGKTFKIKATNNSPENVYIQSALLNGEPYDYSFLSHEVIMNGGELVFTMGPGRSHFASTDDKCPKSAMKNLLAVSPTINAELDGKVFKDSLQISISSPETGAMLLYTLDGTEPNTQSKRYSKPFTIKKDTKVNAVAISGNIISPVVSADYKKLVTDKKITLLSNCHPQYTGGGDQALVDRIRGNVNFRLGGWQGFQGHNFEAIVELSKAKTLKKIALGCLQDTRSWIIFPTEVEFFVSTDGKKYRSVGRVQPNYSTDNYTPCVKDLAVKCNIKAKYIKVVAKSFGKLPSWHLGCGGDSYIFLDEISIND